MIFAKTVGADRLDDQRRLTGVTDRNQRGQLVLGEDPHPVVTPINRDQTAAAHDEVPNSLRIGCVELLRRDLAKNDRVVGRHRNIGVG